MFASEQQLAIRLWMNGVGGGRGAKGLQTKTEKEQKADKEN